MLCRCLFPVSGQQRPGGDLSDPFRANWGCVAPSSAVWLRSGLWSYTKTRLLAGEWQELLVTISMVETICTSSASLLELIELN